MSRPISTASASVSREPPSTRSYTCRRASSFTNARLATSAHRISLWRLISRWRSFGSARVMFGIVSINASISNNTYQRCLSGDRSGGKPGLAQKRRFSGVTPRSSSSTRSVGTTSVAPPRGCGGLKSGQEPCRTPRATTRAFRIPGPTVSAPQYDMRRRPCPRRIRRSIDNQGIHHPAAWRPHGAHRRVPRIRLRRV